MLSQINPDYIELIQLTDTHIFANPETTFDGIDTSESLQQVISLARTTTWPSDAVLLTGDLVHDPEPKAYDRLAVILENIAQPVFCIPGNHDDPAVMHKILQQHNIKTEKAIIFNHWIILMLDTWLPGTHAGHLHENELKFLDQQLRKHNTNHALICLHHSPVSIGSPWMDKMGLQNPADLFAIVDEHPQVQAILWGHIHQEFNSMHKKIKLMSTPSTCVQFSPKSDRYNKDNQSPGYRHLKLHHTGEINTGVFRI